MQVSVAHYVIHRFGGLTKTANALGLAVTTVQGWRDRQRIPQDHWNSVIEAAKVAGFKLTLSDFFRTHEVPDDASPERQSA